MKTISPVLLAYLNSKQEFLLSDLYTIQLVGGFVVYYTAWDVNLNSNGNIFKTLDITRDRTRVSLGLEVDTMTLTVHPPVDELLNGVPWLQAALRGALDSANVKVERVYLPLPGDTTLPDGTIGTVNLFQGRVADLSAGRTEIVLQVKSELELLDVQLPRNLFQPGCMHTVYNNGCQLNRGDFAVSGVVTSSDITSVSSGLTQPEQYFSLGTIKIISGVNTDVSRAVRSYSNGKFSLMSPLVTPCNPGDQFIAWPGCNKTTAQCSAAPFHNLVNFRGFPFIPVPETTQ